MRYLLDTHTFIWFIDNDRQLSAKAAKEIIEIENVCYLSIASIWEIAIKHSNGRLNFRSGFNEITNLLSDNRIDILPMEFHHLQKLLSLEFIHRDPFDRVITAQAMAEDLTIITVDKDIVKYPVKCLW